jgi:hypothetical protein
MFKVSTLPSCMQNICRNESLRDKGRIKKVVFAASVPGMSLETPLFVRDRFRYVGRDATL